MEDAAGASEPRPRRAAPARRRGDSRLRRWRGRILWTVAVLVLVVGSLLRFWVDLLWFDELGHRDVLVTRLQWGTAMGIAFGLFTFAVLYGNFVVARRVARDDLYVPFLAVGADPEAPEQPVVPHFVLRPVMLGIAAIGGVIGGLVMSSRWEVVLRFLGRSDFGVSDPHFGKDASFYVFTMPLLELVARSLQVLIVVTALAVVAAYVATGVIRYTPVPRIARAAIVHLSWLVAAFLVVSAGQFRLSIWNLATSTTGVVAGAGWTDVHARIPGYWLMILASLVLAVLVVLYARRERWRVVGAAVGGWFAASVLLTGIAPAIVQKVVVEPNEQARETKVLTGNIANTRAAFGLDDIATSQFRDERSLDADALLRDNRDTTDNIRLWSPFVLGSVINQEQAIRRYYTFNEPDVDRYTIDGDYRQLMVSVRELDPEAASAAPSWTSERLAYTHGYGLVATLPNEVTDQGKPEYLVKDLPPRVTKEGVDFRLERPEVYFGEETHDYVIAGTKQREISGGDSEDDGGGSNARTSYDGDGGIRVGGLMRRIAFAATFRDPRILFSGQFTDRSRVMFRRQVTERVTSLAPFLTTDSDPYAVVIDGRIKWIVDAYTTSDRFPYSNTPEQSRTQGSAERAADAPDVSKVNYVRNSVKAVVDAYDGGVTLYAMDDGDPILGAWEHIFPDLFTPSSKMSDALRAHLRYPEDLFEVQSSLWRRYHMTDVSDFFQREDEWAIPTLGNSEMEAYYVLAKLPKAKADSPAELLLIRPFTPRGKKNMVAYMVAHSDGERYGDLDTLELSTQETTQGPSQVQALIKQDSDVAQQVREWTTGNNKVVWGNLLVLPIEQSLLYVQPVYLQNSEAEIPEFRKVALALGDVVAWGDDYQQAVEALLAERGDDVNEQGGEDDAGGEPEPELPVPGSGDLADLSREDAIELLGKVSAAYDAAEACQRKADTVCFAEQVERVRQLLDDARRG
jgi:uncharacterized membrane protein (UPF0182 family)